MEAKGEQIGRSYAFRQLGLSKSQLEKMKSDFTGCIRNGKRTLWIQFYDPSFHPPLPEGLEAILGGFPTYFTVSIDMDTWTVINHYASPE